VMFDDPIAPKIVHCSSDFKGREQQAYGTKPSKII
jgi:hypothetical protein